MTSSARVVVVGGGFAGAATAYHLARRGVRDVVVVEREPTFGVHASGRNAALGRQLTEDERVTDFAVRGVAFLRDPPAGFADAPLISRAGSVLLCDDDAELAALEERGRRRGVACERLSMAAVRQRWPRLAGTPGAGGLHVPGDGVIDVHALLSGYLAGARAGGARVLPGCALESLTRRGDRVVAGTSRGDIDCELVVNAAGAWVGEVAALAGARGPVFTPIHRHLFVTEPVADLDGDAPFVWHLGRDEFYLRPEGRGLLLSACDETVSEPCDARVSSGAAEALADKMLRVAPAIAELGVARSWACLRTFAADRRPVIAWDRELSWLCWVAGLGGHGATASPAIGEDAADAVCERLD